MPNQQLRKTVVVRPFLPRLMGAVHGILFSTFGSSPSGCFDVESRL